MIKLNYNPLAGTSIPLSITFKDDFGNKYIPTSIKYTYLAQKNNKEYWDVIDGKQNVSIEPASTINLLITDTNLFENHTSARKVVVEWSALVDGMDTRFYDEVLFEIKENELVSTSSEESITEVVTLEKLNSKFEELKDKVGDDDSSDTIVFRIKHNEDSISELNDSIRNVLKRELEHYTELSAVIGETYEFDGNIIGNLKNLNESKTILQDSIEKNYRFILNIQRHLGIDDLSEEGSIFRELKSVKKEINRLNEIIENNGIDLDSLDDKLTEIVSNKLTLERGIESVNEAGLYSVSKTIDDSFVKKYFCDGLLFSSPCSFSDFIEYDNKLIGLVCDKSTSYAKGYVKSIDREGNVKSIPLYRNGMETTALYCFAPALFVLDNNLYMMLGDSLGYFDGESFTLDYITDVVVDNNHNLNILSGPCFRYYAGGVVGDVVKFGNNGRYNITKSSIKKSLNRIDVGDYGSSNIELTSSDISNIKIIHNYPHLYKYSSELKRDVTYVYDGGVWQVCDCNGTFVSLMGNDNTKYRKYRYFDLTINDDEIPFCYCSENSNHYVWDYEINNWTVSHIFDSAVNTLRSEYTGDVWISGGYQHFDNIHIDLMKFGDSIIAMIMEIGYIFKLGYTYEGYSWKRIDDDYILLEKPDTSFDGEYKIVCENGKFKLEVIE